MEPATRKKRLLESLNEDPRDCKITFFEEGHLYKIEGLDCKLTSVTTLIHNCFPQFDDEKVIEGMMKSKKWPESKYYGKTKEEIKKMWKDSGEMASKLGTMMHNDIERFFNEEEVLNPNTKEFNHFKQFWHEFQKSNPGFKPWRTEMLVYDEDVGIAGSIDFIVADKDGNIIIVDWKRSKEIKKENKYEKGLGIFSGLDNCNYNHYSLQVNIYRHILETKYNKKIVGLYLAIFHPDNEYYDVHMINYIDINPLWKTLNKNNL